MSGWMKHYLKNLLYVLTFYNGTPGEADSHVIDSLCVCKTCGVMFVPRGKKGSDE